MCKLFTEYLDAAVVATIVVYIIKDEDQKIENKPTSTAEEISSFFCLFIPLTNSSRHISCTVCIQGLAYDVAGKVGREMLIFGVW